MTARVIDAATKQPVELFHANVRYKYPPSGSGTATATGHGGLFWFTMGSTRRDTCSNVLATLSATGYETTTVTVTPPFVDNTNEFQLRKAPRRAGEIRVP